MIRPKAFAVVYRFSEAPSVPNFPARPSAPRLKKRLLCNPHAKFRGLFSGFWLSGSVRVLADVHVAGDVQVSTAVGWQLEASAPGDVDPSRRCHGPGEGSCLTWCQVVICFEIRFW